MSIFPHGEGPAVAVVGVGEPGPAVRGHVAEIYEAAFDVPAADLGSVPLPEAVADAEEPLDADAVREAASGAADEYDVVIGVTGRDITAGSRNFVFGLWSRGGSVGVLSTARLSDGPPVDGDGRARLRKVVLKGAGVLFGLERHGDCVMARSPTVRGLDAKPDAFCADCREQFTDPETAPRAPDWRVGARDRGGDGRGRLARLVTYLVFAVLLVFAVPRRLRTELSELTLPRPVRAAVHETYRIGRFWFLVLTYFGAVLAVLAAAYAAYESLAGGDPSTTAFWGLLVASLVGGYLLHLVLRGIAGGLLLALKAAVAGEDLDLEE